MFATLSALSTGFSEQGKADPRLPEAAVSGGVIVDSPHQRATCATQSVVGGSCIRHRRHGVLVKASCARGQEGLLRFGQNCLHARFRRGVAKPGAASPRR